MNIQINMPADYTNYEPIGEGVLLSIAREDVNEMVATEGGILVPKSEDRRNNPLQECLVVAVGPNCKQVAAGDSVLFNLHNSAATNVGNVELRFTTEAHILCITRRKKIKSGSVPEL